MDRSRIAFREINLLNKLLSTGSSKAPVFVYVFTKCLAAFDHLLCLSAFSEAVLEFSCHVLHVSHATNASCTTTFSFQSPVVRTHLLGRVPARRAGCLLDVK